MAEVSAEIVPEESPETWEQLDAALVEGKDIELKQPAEVPEAETPPVEASESEETEPEAEPEPEREITVDYDQDIPLPDHAEPVKLGELKDRFVDYQKRESEMQRREAELSGEYAVLSRMQAEMQANGGQPLNQAQQQEIGQQMQVRLKRERALLGDAVPEWKTPTKFDADRREIIDMMTPYGMTEEQLSSVTDHRFLLFMKHHLDMKRRIDRAETVTPEPVKPVKRPKGHKPSVVSKRTQTDKLVQAAKTSNDDNVKLAAIESLIGE